MAMSQLGLFCQQANTVMTDVLMLYYIPLHNFMSDMVTMV